MKKYTDAIEEYEKTRHLVISLSDERKDLIANCTMRHVEEYNGKLCLERAYRDTRLMCKENNEFFEFAEVLEEGHEAGVYCNNCIESYRLKIGDLADARKAFGNAKRKLSFLGKRIIAMRAKG